MNLFGFEIIKISLFVRGLLFAVLLMVAIHYAVILVINSFSKLKKGNWLAPLLTVLYIVVVTLAFYFFIGGSFFYKIISYIILTLYILVLLSRGFVNWYTRTEEISKKLDRIIELLEKGIG